MSRIIKLGNLITFIQQKNMVLVTPQLKQKGRLSQQLKSVLEFTGAKWVSTQKWGGKNPKMDGENNGKPY